jgi:Domain of unknown function (DUF1918)
MSPPVQRYRAAVGDVVSIDGHHVGDARRTGQILEVLGEPGHEHFRVLWEDESETVFYPGSDAIVRPKRVRRPATRKET